MAGSLLACLAGLFARFLLISYLGWLIAVDIHTLKLRRASSCAVMRQKEASVLPVRILVESLDSSSFWTADNPSGIAGFAGPRRPW